MKQQVRHDTARALWGHRAGFASRATAAVVDLGVVWLIGLALLLVAGIARYLVAGPPLRLPAPASWVNSVGAALIAVGYLTYWWVTTGRTPGDQLAGLRVVTLSGRRLSPFRALVRAALCVVFPVGLLWALISRVNASVQDVVVRSAVVYDWSYHAPEG